MTGNPPLGSKILTKQGGGVSCEHHENPRFLAKFGQFWANSPLKIAVWKVQNRDFFAPAAGFPPYKSTF